MLFITVLDTESKMANILNLFLSSGLVRNISMPPRLRYYSSQSESLSVISFLKHT